MLVRLLQPIHFVKHLSQGFIVRAIDPHTFGEHATQTKIMRDPYCRSTFRTGNRRLLQMEINRHALYQKCFDLRPKRPRPPLIKPSVFFPPCFSTEIGKRSYEKCQVVTDRPARLIRAILGSDTRINPLLAFFLKNQGPFPYTQSRCQ